MKATSGRSTQAIHAGAAKPRIKGAVATPIFQSSTYEFLGEDYHGIGYMRLSNSPNHLVLGERLAALEGTEAALVTASGMASISAALLTILDAGDHILVQDCLYGGTNTLLNNILPRWQIAQTPVDGQDVSSWAGQIRPTTKALYVESITNPLIQVADLEGAVAFAKEHGLISIIDNTFASPVNFRPAELGFDLVVESATKYLNGHTDIIAGVVAGPEELVGEIKVMLDHLGGFMDTHTCFLLERGIKTLPVRVREQNTTALRIAQFLEGHQKVTRVNYPGLLTHDQHERATRLFDGFGGMLSFELDGGVAEADAFMNTVTLPAHAASLGGVESLVVRPAVTSHAGLTPEERARSGISDTLIRFSVGLEDADDLIGDLERALG